MLKPIEEEDLDRCSSSNASRIENHHDMFTDDQKRMTLNTLEPRRNHDSIMHDQLAVTEKAIHSMNKSHSH